MSHHTPNCVRNYTQCMVELNLTFIYPGVDCGSNDVGTGLQEP